MTTSSSDWQSSSRASEGPAPENLSIRTPEMVAIEFPLAGIGSRFVAVLLDYLFWAVGGLVVVLIIVLIAAAIPTPSTPSPPLGPKAQKWLTAIMIAIPFVVQWGYFTLFEAYWRGQTPGKRIMRIRVIQQTGRPISLLESMGRNLVRVVDWFPGIYMVGVICMFVTRRQQRLGDLVAGTLVVHDREIERPLDSIGASRTFTTEIFQPVVVSSVRESKLPADVVSALTLADLQALESYMARKLDVPMAVREQLAAQLAGNISRKMNFPIPADMSQEMFLEEVAFMLRSTQYIKR